MKLDGTDKITPTPFDAHEKVVRGSHTHSAAEGYQTLEQQEHEEYPKAVAHNEETGEPIVARDAKHEVQLKKDLEAKKEDKE